MVALYFICGLLWAITSIIMVVKFFQMSSDLRALKKHFVPITDTPSSAYDPTEEIKGVFKAKGVTYTIKKEFVTFSDGKVGNVVFYPYLTKYSFRADDFVSDDKYNDVHYAAEALYDYLTTK